MSLRRLRRRSAPVALVTYASLFLTITPVRRVQAAPGEGADSPRSSSAQSEGPPPTEAPAANPATSSPYGRSVAAEGLDDAKQTLAWREAKVLAESSSGKDSVS